MSRSKSLVAFSAKIRFSSFGVIHLSLLQITSRLARGVCNSGKYFSHRHVENVGHVDSFARVRVLKASRRAWKTARAYGKSIAQPPRGSTRQDGFAFSVPENHLRTGTFTRNRLAILPLYSTDFPRFLIYHERASPSASLPYSFFAEDVPAESMRELKEIPRLIFPDSDSPVETRFKNALYQLNRSANSASQCNIALFTARDARNDHYAFSATVTAARAKHEEQR